MNKRHLSFRNALAGCALSVCALAGVTGSLNAQCTGFTSQTINDRNVAFTQLNVPDSRSSLAGGANFTADAPNQRDVLFALWHYYRLDGMSRETPFKDVPRQCLNVSYEPNRATFDWPDVDGLGRISAQLVLEVQSRGSAAGCVTSRMTITNIETGAVTLNLFTYADIDLCGAGSNTAAAVGTDGTVQLVQNQMFCRTSTNVEFRGIGADHYEVAAYPDLVDRLVDATQTDLADTGLPFGPGDYSAAVQWQDRVLQPGESITLVAQVCHNAGGCSTRAGSANYGSGLAGTNGLPTLTTTQLPFVGGAGIVAVGNALPMNTGLMLIGGGRANTQLGNLTILVNPLDTAQIMTDMSGAASLELGIPGDSNLCGVQAQLQYFFVDGGVVGTFPVAHTDAVEWTLGS